MSPKLQRIVDEHLFEIALATPRVATAKIAAALVYKGRVYAYGVNTKKSNPFQKKYGMNEHSIYPHAEITAIKNGLRYFAVEELRHTTLLVCRVKWHEDIKMWGMGLAKPCKGCQAAIAEFGIKKVFYSTDENTMEVL